MSTQENYQADECVPELCPNGHPATLLYTKRVGEVDTIICCAGCDVR